MISLAGRTALVTGGNAGIWPPEEVRLRDMDERRWRATMAADLDAVFLSTRAALRHLRPGGRVVLVGSTAGQRGEAHHADYAATKGAVIALVRTLAVECAPGPGPDRCDDPARPHRNRRGRGGSDRVPLQRPRVPRDGRDPQRERWERAVRVSR